MIFSCAGPLVLPLVARAGTAFSGDAPKAIVAPTRSSAERVRDTSCYYAQGRSLLAPVVASAAWASVPECHESAGATVGAVSREQAQSILSTEVERLRQVGYEDLVSRLLDKQETFEKAAPDGTRYQVEVQGFWDDETDRSLRVLVNVDDGGWRSFVPLSGSFITAPDGSFVGE
jgi:hypothetical protein